MSVNPELFHGKVPDGADEAEFQMFGSFRTMSPGLQADYLSLALTNPGVMSPELSSAVLAQTGFTDPSISLE